MKLWEFMERARLARRAKQPNREERRRALLAFVAAHPMATQEEIALGTGVSVGAVKLEMPLLRDKVLPVYGKRGSGTPVRYITKERACSRGPFWVTKEAADA